MANKPRDLIIKLRIAGILGLAILTTSVCSAAAPSTLNPSLKRFLQTYIAAQSPSGKDQKTQIAVASVELNNGNTEYVIYFSGGAWCSVTGNCAVMYVEEDHGQYKALGRTTLARLPIRVLPSSTKGHPDIGISVFGRAFPPHSTAILRFDGESYPLNPSIQPALQKGGDHKGKVLINEKTPKTSLYD